MSSGKIILALVWVILAGVIYYFAESALNPNKLSLLGEDRTVTLERGIDGHYRAEALINGKKINVMVDTGATGVAISQQIADKLGLESKTAIRTRTANGDSVAYVTRLDSIQIGGVEAKNVSALIAPGLGGDVLLGMSFLGRMDVRLYKNTMTIKQIDE
jgi:aspartyl protease family protein